MAEPITEAVQPEAGKREIFSQVTVGLCQDFKVAAAKPNELCASFELKNPMAGDNGGVTLKESDLPKAIKNTSVAGYAQAQQMMRTFGR